MPQPDFTIGQNDSGETISATLTEGGAPVDLTGASVEFMVAALSGGDLVVDAAAAVSGTPTEGGVSYDWQSADTAAAGLFLASWRVTFGSGEVKTFPVGSYTLVRIIGELGAIDPAGAPAALWPPVGWMISRVGEFTLSPDNSDGDVVALRIKKFGDDGGDFVEFVLTDAQDVDWGKIYNHTAWMNDGDGVGVFAFGNPQASSEIANWFGVSQGGFGIVAPGQLLAGDTRAPESTMAWGVQAGGAEFFFPTAAPDDENVATSQRVHWFDDTSGAPALRFKERDVDGTLTAGKSVGISDGGVIKLAGLPTSDPAVANQLWNSAGALKVSAG